MEGILKMKALSVNKIRYRERVVISGEDRLYFYRINTQYNNRIIRIIVEF